MKEKIQLIFLWSLLFIGCNLSHQFDKPFDSHATSFLLNDTVNFERPFDINVDYPAYLRLYKSSSFEYFSMPAWSCWVMTETKGRWHVNHDTLTLSYSVENFNLDDSDSIKKIVRYKIEGEKVKLLADSNGSYPLYEMEMVANINFQKLINSTLQQVE